MLRVRIPSWPRRGNVHSSKGSQNDSSEDPPQGAREEVMGIFKGKKRPSPPWDYLIEKGHITEDKYDEYEKAIADGNYEKAQAIEALAAQPVGDVKERKKKD